MCGFVAVARNAFGFLETERGFTLTDSVEGTWGGSLTYVNLEKGVAVKPQYEFSAAFVFLFIYKLENGKIVENEYPIVDCAKINSIDFNDVLPVEKKMRAAYDYANHSEYFDEKYGLRNFVRDFSVRLHDYGSDLLQGDFTAFERVGAIIKSRAESPGANQGVSDGLNL